LRNVVPGSYTILAIENGWELNWSQPAVIAAYMSHGRTIQVGNPAGRTMSLAEAVEVQSKQIRPQRKFHVTCSPNVTHALYLVAGECEGKAAHSVSCRWPWQTWARWDARNFHEETCLARGVEVVS